MRNDDIEEEEMFDEGSMNIMEDVSEEDVNDFMEDYNEDLGHLLGADMENVDNIDKDPFE